MWFWIGVWVLIAGTGIALVPNAAPITVRQPSRAEAAAVEVGD